MTEAIIRIPCPSMRLIKEVVADEFGVTLLDLESERRHQPLARARQVVMYLARYMTRLSLPQIGRHLGDRDHTTVMYGISQITRLMNEDGAFATKIRLMMDALSRPAPFTVIAA